MKICRLRFSCFRRGCAGTAGIKSTGDYHKQHLSGASRDVVLEPERFHSSGQPHITPPALAPHLQVGECSCRRARIFFSANPPLPPARVPALSPALRFAARRLWPSHPKGFPAAESCSWKPKRGPILPRNSVCRLRGAGRANEGGLARPSPGCHAETALFASKLGCLEGGWVREHQLK